MKKIAFILCLATIPLLFTSCHQKEKDAQAQKRADSLQSIIDSKDGEIDALFDVLNQIEDNLTAVTDKYSKVQQLRSGGVENNNVKGEITDQITTIESMLADNKTKLAGLNATIKKQGKENKQLQEFVAKLEERIANQETQISQLLTELENNKIVIKGLNENINTLNHSNQEKDAYIARQTAEANKAYFVVGTYKELKEIGIVTKSGGFIGLGKKQNTNADMNTENFTMIDRTKVTTITINKKKAVVISKHPQGSFELVMDESNPAVAAYLKILNPASFWKYTDYLVISTK